MGADRNAKLMQLVSRLNSLSPSPEVFSLVGAVAETIGTDTKAAGLFAGLIEQAHNKTAAVWVARGIRNFYESCSLDVMLVVLSGILRGKDAIAMEYALQGTRVVIDQISDSLAARGSSCIPLSPDVIDTFAASWGVHCPYQELGGEIFRIIGAREQAIKYFDAIRRERLDAALLFGAGAGLEEQVRRCLDYALQSEDVSVVLAALFAISAFRLTLDYLDGVLRLSYHPNDEVGRFALCLLIPVADKDRSGRVRKRVADFLLYGQGQKLPVAVMYTAHNREIDEELLTGLLYASGEATGGDSVLRWIVSRALEDPRVAEMVLAYQPQSKSESLVKTLARVSGNRTAGNWFRRLNEGDKR